MRKLSYDASCKKKMFGTGSYYRSTGGNAFKRGDNREIFDGQTISVMSDIELFVRKTILYSLCGRRREAAYNYSLLAEAGKMGG